MNSQAKNFGRKMVVTIYTDGSCIQKEKVGGWAYILYDAQERSVRVGYAGEENTTNNRMELSAVIKSLEMCARGVEIVVYTDSQWVKNGAEGTNKRKKNLDLWNTYDRVSKDKVVKFVWVKAHAGNKLNELVDKLAYSESIKKLERIPVSKKENKIL